MGIEKYLSRYEQAGDNVFIVNIIAFIIAKNESRKQKKRVQCPDGWGISTNQKQLITNIQKDIFSMTVVLGNESDSHMQ